MLDPRCDLPCLSAFASRKSTLNKLRSENFRSAVPRRAGAAWKRAWNVFLARQHRFRSLCTAHIQLPLIRNVVEREQVFFFAPSFHSLMMNELGPVFCTTQTALQLFRRTKAATTRTVSISTSLSAPTAQLFQVICKFFCRHNRISIFCELCARV